MLGSDLLSRRSDHGEEPPEEAVLLPPNMFIGAINLDLISRILSALPSDSFAKYIQNALNNPAPSPHRHSLEDWSEQDGLLMFRGRTYVPDDLELHQEIVRSFHDLPSAGHPGRLGTLALVQPHYYWPGMSVFIKNFVTGCALCQQMKVNTHPTLPPLNPIAADPSALPFQTVTMDFITDLPLSNGCDTLLVVVDHDVSKAIVLIPTTKNVDALEMAALYHSHVYKRYGLPKRIISD